MTTDLSTGGTLDGKNLLGRHVLIPVEPFPHVRLLHAAASRKLTLAAGDSNGATEGTIHACKYMPKGIKVKPFWNLPPYTIGCRVPHMLTLREKVKEAVAALKKDGIRQEDIAEGVKRILRGWGINNVSVQQGDISKILRGRTPKAHVFMGLAAYLGIDPMELLTGVRGATTLSGEQSEIVGLWILADADTRELVRRTLLRFREAKKQRSQVTQVPSAKASTTKGPQRAHRQLPNPRRL